ncbi:MAG: DegV family protein [Ruthenibacterium sp.]
MIRILTDSTADIFPQQAAQLGVLVVPLQVNFGSEHFRDGIELTPEAFYEKLQHAEKLPTTSQPSPELFQTHFEAAQRDGDTLICILISASLSGTCQSAQIAKDEIGYDNIYIVDSKSATLAESLLVHRALQRITEGFSAGEIVADLETAREHLRLLAVVDDLTYLRKGGRLSSAAAFAGGLLGIKPVVALNYGERKPGGHDGKLGLAGKARGMPGAYVAIFKMIASAGGIDETWPVAVGYTGNRHGVEPFVRYVTQNLHLQKPTVNPIGAVIGTHAGPGACGIAFFDAME